MGTVLGFLLGRRRYGRDAEWARELEAHVDELRAVVRELERRNAALEVVAGTSREVVASVQPLEDPARKLLAELASALAALDRSRTGS